MINVEDERQKIFDEAILDELLAKENATVDERNKVTQICADTGNPWDAPIVLSILRSANGSY